MKFYVAILVAVLGCVPEQARSARKTNDQYTLAFAASWCEACERDKPFYRQIPNLHVVDSDQSPGVLLRWRVNKLPTYLVVKNGKVIIRTGNIHKVIQYHGQIRR